MKQELKKATGINPQNLFRGAWGGYRVERMTELTPYIIEVVEKMMKCRDPEGLGYHKYACPEHPNEERVVPHSCKTRICTTCAKIQNDIWGEEMKQIFPRGHYFHITLTIPEEFREFFGKDDKDWKRKSALYELGQKAIQGYFSSKNIQTGGITVLHTFGRALNLNPHLHIIIPAGGLRETKEGWKWINEDYVSREYLSKAWKWNLLEYILSHTPYFSSEVKYLMNCIREESLEGMEKITKFVEKNVPYSEQEKWFKVLSIDYYINISLKKEYSQTICYVSRYTRRLPISKSKILEWNQETNDVTWRYIPHGKTKQERMPVDTTMHIYSFFDRILLHIPPKNFRLVRYFGIFSQHNISFFESILKNLCEFDVSQKVPSWRERQMAYTGIDPLICPCCKKDMILIEKAHISSTGSLIISNPQKSS